MAIDGSTASALPSKPRPILESIAVSLATDPPIFSRVPTVINLSSVAIAGEAFLTLTGKELASNSVVRLDGREVTTEFVSSTSLRISLTPGNLSRQGEYRVTVFTPSPGGGTSNAMMLYAEPAPRWGLLEKALVAGALVAAALWILWMINAPLPNRLAGQAPTLPTESTEVQPAATAPSGAADPDAEQPTAAAPDQPSEPGNWQLTWFTMFIILAIFTFGVGRALTGTWKSLLIDERNKQSLSRLQLVLWTGLVTSAIAAAVAWNIHIGAVDPLGIQVPQELWILLGISATALVGSNFIKDQQSSPKLTEEQANERLSQITNGAQAAQGELAANVSLIQARWTDMFQSEGANNFNKLDVGKIQLFFFTIIVVLAYAAAFARTAFHPFPTVPSAPGRFEFPPLEGSLVALVGVSSFFYLANKAGKPS